MLSGVMRTSESRIYGSFKRVMIEELGVVMPGASSEDELLKFCSRASTRKVICVLSKIAKNKKANTVDEEMKRGLLKSRRL